MKKGLLARLPQKEGAGPLFYRVYNNMGINEGIDKNGR